MEKAKQSNPPQWMNTASHAPPERQLAPLSSEWTCRISRQMSIKLGRSEWYIVLALMIWLLDLYIGKLTSSDSKFLSLLQCCWIPENVVSLKATHSHWKHNLCWRKRAFISSNPTTPGPTILLKQTAHTHTHEAQLKHKISYVKTYSVVKLDHTLELYSIIYIFRTKASRRLEWRFARRKSESIGGVGSEKIGEMRPSIP